MLEEKGVASGRGEREAAVANGREDKEARAESGGKRG